MAVRAPSGAWIARSWAATGPYSNKSLLADCKPRHGLSQCRRPWIRGRGQKQRSGQRMAQPRRRVWKQTQQTISTATYGGGIGCNGQGSGAVYKITPSGTETVLYSFTGGADGSNPYYADLVPDPAGNSRHHGGRWRPHVRWPWGLAAWCSS